jgi:hypothetical protein
MKKTELNYSGHRRVARKDGREIRGGLISRWLYKENNKLRDWKNVFTLHIPPWAPHTYDFILLTSLTHQRKILLVVLQLGKAKDLSAPLRTVRYLNWTFPEYECRPLSLPDPSQLLTSSRSVVSFTPRLLYPPGKSPWYPLERRLGEPQSRRRENFWSYRNSNSDPSVAQPVASRCTDYVIPDHVNHLWINFTL